ncbi:MAG: preprotein translocase subunit YajC [bacterium]|nr:preprotein translocase subunit YajC [Gemmatimonadota bacterium]HIL90306.1 preprotein translocase subunit YajC [Gemmatimonadota bacterium]
MNFAFNALMMVPRGPNSMVINMGMMGLMVAILYFMLIRPEAKKRERHEMMLSSVKKGDDIVTTGGIIGKVVHAEETQLIVRTGESTRVTMDRTCIVTVLDHKGNALEE